MSEIKDYGNISFELLPECWLVRGHPNSDGFGNSYDWAFVLVKNGNAAIAKGMVSDNMLGSDDVKTIRQFLKDNDLTHVEYMRIRPGSKTKHKLK
jgi:hypothetical protein